MSTTGQGQAEQGAAEVNGQAAHGRSVVGGMLAGLRLAVASGVTGVAVAAVVVGVILERVPVFLSGGGEGLTRGPDRPARARSLRPHSAERPYDAARSRVPAGLG
ncbi:hypothetical protein ACIOML_36415 [Streptomyces anulatus]